MAASSLCRRLRTCWRHKLWPCSQRRSCAGTASILRFDGHSAIPGPLAQRFGIRAARRSLRVKAATAKSAPAALVATRKTSLDAIESTDSQDSGNNAPQLKPHASRGRKIGPQSSQHLRNRVISLKRTLMAQTPERRRKRCSICGEIGHNKLSCPTAPDAMPRKNTVTCSQCGQPGHNSRSCPVKPRSTTVTCSQCGRDGHNCRTCPMRAKSKKGKAGSASMNSMSRVCSHSQPCAA
jgi:hypothetical protein